MEPLSFITEPRYLKLVTVSSFSPMTLTSVLMQHDLIFPTRVLTTHKTPFPFNFYYLFIYLKGGLFFFLISTDYFRNEIAIELFFLCFFVFCFLFLGCFLLLLLLLFFCFVFLSTD